MTLVKASNTMAFAKVGIYGEAGSGKTYTAATIAIGLHRASKLTGPVAMFDTELAASYVAPLFAQAGIEFLVDQGNRSLSSVLKFFDEAEAAQASIVIVDSVSHIWKDVQESYLAKINDGRNKAGKNPVTRLEFQDWAIVKSAWEKFTDRYLTSHLHCFICGRAGSVYEYQKNDRTNKMELITTGTKMATEKNLSYEPSLLIEMDKRPGGSGIVNVATVEKDRTARLMGKEIPFPDYEKLKAHFEFLNIGGGHAVLLGDNSKGMFNDDGNDEWTAERRNRDIVLEEVKAVLALHGLDGTGTEAKKTRVVLLEQHFGTASATKMDSMSSEKLREGYTNLRVALEGRAVVNLKAIAKPEAPTDASQSAKAADDFGLPPDYGREAGV